MKACWLFCFLVVAVVVGCRREPTTSQVISSTPSSPQAVDAQRRPSGNYVDDAVCADCHAGVAAEFARHPMARSLTTPATRTAMEAFTPQHRAEFDAVPFRYQAEGDAARLVHSRQLLPLDAEPKIVERYEVAYVVGSGQRGRSYLVQRDDKLFMSPLTWYVQQQMWDLSPGYDENDLGFQRVVLEDCLFCHSNQAPREPDSKNTYRDPIFPRGHAIGCQRCHGPGQRHVETQSSGVTTGQSPDTSIINPAHLEPSLREAVCQQCHLAGVARVTRANRDRYEFRPGMPLDAVISTFVLASSPRGKKDHFVGQVEQMYASRCFQQSDGQLGCISCHDPHAVPSEGERAAFYRQRCLQCHADRDCLLEPTQRTTVAGNDCVACHMPAIETDVRHAAATDHRIPRAPDSPTRSTVSGSRPRFPIVAFPPRVSQEDDVDALRDVALGILQAAQYHPQQVVDSHLQRLIRPLQQAIARNPLDTEGREALGDLLLKLQRREGMAHYRRVLERSPDREHSLVKLAEAAATVGELEEAVLLWEKANRCNDQLAAYRAHWVEALAQDGRWRAMHQAALEGTQRFPTTPRIWHFLLESYLRLGQTTEARQTLSVWRRLQPQDADQIQAWFDAHPLRSDETQ